MALPSGSSFRRSRGAHCGSRKVHQGTIGLRRAMGAPVSEPAPARWRGAGGCRAGARWGGSSAAACSRSRRAAGPAPRPRRRAGAASRGARPGQAIGPQRLALLGRPAADHPGGRARAERRVPGLVVQQLGVGPAEQRLAHQRARGRERRRRDRLAERELGHQRARQHGLVRRGALPIARTRTDALMRAPGSSSSSTRAQTSRWWISSWTTRPAIARIAAGASSAARSAARWADADDAAPLVLRQPPPTGRDASQQQRGVVRPVQRVRFHAAGSSKRRALNGRQRRAKTPPAHDIPRIFVAVRGHHDTDVAA